MSNRLFQGFIHQMKDSVDRVVGVMDENGNIVACTQLSLIGEQREDVISELSYSTDVIALSGWTYKLIGSRAKIEYAVFVQGNDDIAAKYAALITVSLTNIKQYYDEKFDKSIFIKNVILDNILANDILVKAKELQLPTEVSRVAMLIRLVDKSEISALDVLYNIFPDKQKDFIINISETDMVLIKEVKYYTDAKELEQIAESIVDTLNAEFYINSFVGIGAVVNNIKDLARSFKESQIALEVGKVFDTEKVIINYESLGICRLIYTLPTTVCEMFMSEVFKKGSIDSLDHETLFTIQKFFENNLNVSETSRKLFVHRNTLVYRLEKIRKLTGLDLREFDHAIIFKVALMVKKFLVANPTRL